MNEIQILQEELRLLLELIIDCKIANCWNLFELEWLYSEKTDQLLKLLKEK